VNKILEIAHTYKNFPDKFLIGRSAYGLPDGFYSMKKHEQNAIMFLSIDKPGDLSRFLRVPFLQLERIINNPVYTEYSIKKKRGGQREICAPDRTLKFIQKKLNYFLQAYYLIIKPEEVHGFVINPHYLGSHCNIVANASTHVGKKHVLNIDLKDFFPGITARKVKQLFSSDFFIFNEQISTALTLLTTYKGKLPIGAPSSPVIANFICYELDRSLREFSETNNLRYSRYADDLTFSANDSISSDCLLDIVSIINENGFSINEKKLRLKTSYRKQTVTGLTVNEKVNVDRKLLKKIRAMIHDLSQNGLNAATKKHFKCVKEAPSQLKDAFINKLNGYINFVGQVRGKNDALYLRFKQEVTICEHANR